MTALKLSVSQVPALLGLSRIVSPSDVVKSLVDKMTGGQRFSREGWAIDNGKIFEDAILTLTAKTYSLEITGREVDLENEYLIGRCDALAVGRQGKYVLEAKYSTQIDYDEVNNAAMVQAAVYAKLAGADGFITAVLARDTQAKVETRRYGKDTIDTIYHEVLPVVKDVIQKVLRKEYDVRIDTERFVRVLTDVDAAELVRELIEASKERMRYESIEKTLKERAKNKFGVGRVYVEGAGGLEIVQKMRRTLDTRKVETLVGDDPSYYKETVYLETRILR